MTAVFHVSGAKKAKARNRTANTPLFKDSAARLAFKVEMSPQPCPNGGHMNISHLLNFTSFGNASSARAAPKSVEDLSPLAQAVQRADARVATEVAANTAQLSTLGQLKSSVVDVQSAAQRLQKLASSAKPEDIQAAVVNLAQAFNAATAMAQTASNPTDPSDLSHSAKRVRQDLLGAMNSATADPKAMQAVGLNGVDGALQLDLQALNNAASNQPEGTLALLKDLGARLNTAATGELDSHGRLTDSMAALQRASQVLQAQQSALQSAALATSPATDNKRAGMGLKAYLSNIG